VNSPVFAEIIAGATEAVRIHDYTLLVGTQPDDAEGDPLYAKLARANQVDGVIVAPRRRDAALSQGLAALKIPLVVAHTKIQGVPYCVTLDSFTATKAAIGHLIALGHRRIAYLARRAVFYNDGRRLAGFRAAHRSAGLGLDDALVLHTPHTYRDTYAHTVKLLQTRATPPTAIFTVSLIATAGAMKALEDAGLRIPHDVSIMALYDHEFADALKPPVTTMRMPRANVGHVAARVLIDVLEGRPPPADLVLPPGELIVRESTAPPPM
jgi:LacI family transcriptional regulator